MPHVHLIHWRAEEAAERVAQLQAAGFDVTCTTQGGSGMLKRIREHVPDAVVIDLSRLPSHGREVGGSIRESAVLCRVPLVFVDGAPDKVKVVRKLLPDATYARWRGISGAVRRAISRPVRQPVVPASHMSRYAGTPLCKKLGIQEGTRTGLINAPKELEKDLGELPSHAVIQRTLRGKVDLILWFVGSVSELEKRIDQMADKTSGGGLWICWPKQSSGVRTDVTQAVVRRSALAAGLVDYKICSVNATWSGLRFARKKSIES